MTLAWLRITILLSDLASGGLLIWFASQVVHTGVSLCWVSAGLDVCEHDLPGLSATVSPEILAISPELQLPSLWLPHLEGRSSHSRTALWGAKTLTILDFAAWTLYPTCRSYSHHGLLEVQGSIAAAIIVIIIAIAACGLATFFLMRMRSRRMNQVRMPLFLTL